MVFRQEAPVIREKWADLCSTKIRNLMVDEEEIDVFFLKWHTGKRDVSYWDGRFLPLRVGPSHFICLWHTYTHTHSRTFSQDGTLLKATLWSGLLHLHVGWRTERSGKRTALIYLASVCRVWMEQNSGQALLDESEVLLKRPQSVRVKWNQ